MTDAWRIVEPSKKRTKEGIKLHIDTRCRSVESIDLTASSESSGIPTDDGCLGGGGSVSISVSPDDSTSPDFYAYRDHFTSGRSGIFKYCILTDDKSDSELADDGFSIRGNVPPQSMFRALTLNLLQPCDWLDMETDSDDNGLSDAWENFMGLEGELEELIDGAGFRVIKIYRDRLETRMYHLYEDELNLYSDDEVSMSGISPETDILYPSSGCPGIVKTGGKLTIHIKNIDDVYRIDLLPCFGISDTISPVIVGSIENGNNANTMSITVKIQDHYPAGLYDLVVYGSKSARSSHSVQIIDEYRSGGKDDSLVIVQITDTHIGTGEGTSGMSDRLIAVMNRINEFMDPKPDFVIITGDLTQKDKENEMKKFKDSLLRCQVPVFCTPGNHDHYHGKWNNCNIATTAQYAKYISPAFFEEGEATENEEYEEGNDQLMAEEGHRGVAFFREHLAKHHAGLDYSFDYGDNFHFISFDSGPELNKYTECNGLSNDQLQWIKDVQEKHDGENNHTFIFTHAPFSGHKENGYLAHDQNDGDFIEWANGLIADGKNCIEATFHGHTHKPAVFGPDVSKDDFDGTDVMYWKENDEQLWDWHNFHFDGTNPWQIECDALKG